MSCSCHINPPCYYCTNTYECIGCGELKSRDEDGLWLGVNDKDVMVCDECMDDSTTSEVV